ncbi:hemopexin repeat-containing protein [Streptomyces sp. JNUCC 64]
MPPPLVATLNLDDTDPTAFATFVNAIRDHVAVAEPGQVDASANSDRSRLVTMYRLRRTGSSDSPDTVFVVRLVAGSDASVDWYVQDTDLYGWGFTLTGQRDFYHLSNPTAGILRMAAAEGFVLHDTGIHESYGSDGLPRGPLGWAALRTALVQLGEGPGVRDHQRSAMGFLVEMVCEAVRFRMIARTLHGLWGTTGSVSQDQRDRITEAETNWSSLSGLFDRYREAPGEPVPDTVLTRPYGTLAAVALALTILHGRPGTQPGSSSSGAKAAGTVAAGERQIPRGRLYPVLDAGGNLPDASTAWFFRPGTSLTYDLVHDTVATGDPRSFGDAFPALRDTEFALRLDTVVAVPGSSTDVWLFSGHRYTRYDTGTHKTVYGPKDIAVGWPALTTTSFTDRVDAAVHDPGDPSGGLFLFRDAEVLYYHLRDDTVTGPHAIAEHFPGLAGTSFAHGVSAALTVPGNSGQLWLFRGDYYVRYDLQTSSLVVGPQHVHEGWEPLRRKAFTDGVSSVLPCPGPVPKPSEVWMFHDDLYLRFDLDANTVTQEARRVGPGWPGLDTHGFADRVDAVIPKPDAHQAWFFRDDQYLRYDLDDSRVVVPPTPIASGWTGLSGTDFAHGIDAALPDPGDSDGVWLFAGDQYVRYQLAQDRLAVGPTPIARTWTALRGTPFSRRVDAACVRPGTKETWLFSGDSYVRYDPGQDVILAGPKRIVDGWDLGFPVR